MEKDFLQIEQIENYLTGKLSQAEEQEINQRLADDAEFREFFDQIEALLEGIRASGAKTSLEEKLARLAGTSEEIDSNPQLRRPEAKQVSFTDYFEKYKIAIAASIALVAVSWFALTTVFSPSAEDLFAENFVAYSAPNSITRGESSQQLEGLAAAYAEYARGAYGEAAESFEESMSESSNLEKDKFYLANAYLASGDPNKASELFNEVVELNGPLQTLGYWYLGLSYLELNDVENARNSLKKVVEADAEKSLEAQLILQDL